jgi:TolB-like protein
MKRYLIVGLLVCLALSAVGAEKTSVAFLGLEASGVSEASAAGIADTLLDALINTKRFEIVERERLAGLMEEQGLALSGCTTTECFVQLGQLAGASKVVVGKVSKVGTTYTVNVRVVDVYLGKVELSEASESSSLDDLLEAARQMAERLAANIPVIGTVVDVEGDNIKIDLGSQEGTDVGDEVTIYRLGEEYYHPETGLFLGRDIEELASAEVSTVIADELSEARVTQYYTPVTMLTVGDKVRVGAEPDEHETTTTTTSTSRPGGGGDFGLYVGGLFGVSINGAYDGIDPDGWTEGLHIGGRLGFNYFFSKAFGAGLYLSLQTYTDEFDYAGYYPATNTWLELLVGPGFKFNILTKGTVRPYVAAGLGYALTYLTMDREDDYAYYTFECSGGSFGADLTVGADFCFGGGFGVGVGALLHYNATSEVEYDGGTAELEESPVSVGGVVDLVFTF